MDQRDEMRACGNRALRVVEIDAAIALRLDAMDSVALPREQVTRLLGGGMFDGAGDDAAVAIALHDAADRHVAGFGAAAGEDDLVRLRADQRRDMAARGVDGVFGAAAQRVTGRRVAERVAQERQHGVEHIRRDRRGGVVIEIDRHACFLQ
jgi:hypothetical protein